jgi:hypothetical protein
MRWDCEDARLAIERRRLVGWRGLPPDCTPEALFGVALDGRWGERQLGADFEPARTRLLEIDGYYRPMAYVRVGKVAMFAGMNPELETSWKELSDALGPPEAVLDWTHATTEMERGERVYARSGITVFVNPHNDFVVHLSLYVPTSTDVYFRRLRMNYTKRPLPTT